MNRYFV